MTHYAENHDIQIGGMICTINVSLLRIKLLLKSIREKNTR